MLIVSIFHVLISHVIASHVLISYVLLSPCLDIPDKTSVPSKRGACRDGMRILFCLTRMVVYFPSSRIFVSRRSHETCSPPEPLGRWPKGKARGQRQCLRSARPRTPSATLRFARPSINRGTVSGFAECLRPGGTHKR